MLQADVRVIAADALRIRKRTVIVEVLGE